MEFSENWLREWIHPNIDKVSLRDQISKSGLELEKITKVKCLFKNIVVGEIIDACFLNELNKQSIVFEIQISKDKKINVLSESIKYFIGMKVAVATFKSTLAFNKVVNSFSIQKKVYEGMICTFKDLGYSSHISDYIVKIESDIPIGTDLSELLAYDDNIFRISSTPNRADALSIIGLARDISAFNGFFLPKIKKYVIKTTILDKLEVKIDISSDICSRFCGRIIKNVNCSEQTPIWLLEKLRRSSIKSCNVIIDIINYVLIELGQPLYALDLNDICGKLIILRKAYKHEQYLNVNEKSFIINNNAVVISDKLKILTLSGHVESHSSRVSINSKHLFLGFAFFNTFNNSDLNFEYGDKNCFTERYVRGVDSNMQNHALEYATYLILKICGGNAGELTISEKKHNNNYKCITLFKKNLLKYLGYYINSQKIVKILLQFGYLVKSNDLFWSITPPSWRFDIKIEEDVISELIRILGYDKCLSTALSSVIKININDLYHIILDRVKLLLVDLGYHEIISYGFVNPSIQKLLFPSALPLYLSNPISYQMSSMRLTLLNGLLSHILYNQNRQEKVIRCFESGLCFFIDKNNELGVNQKLCLSGAISGYNYEPNWNIESKIVNFYDLKQDLELILDILGKHSEIQFKSECISSGFNIYESAVIYLDNLKIGFIGAIHSNLQKLLGLKYKTIVFELIWEKLAISEDFKITKISKYPKSIRDISFIIDENINVGEILSECRQIVSNNFVEVKLIDIFRGNSLGINKKSLSLRLTFENNKKTLQEQEIVIIVNNVIQLLQQKFNAILRDGKV